MASVTLDEADMIRLRILNVSLLISVAVGGLAFVRIFVLEGSRMGVEA